MGSLRGHAVGVVIVAAAATGAATCGFSATPGSDIDFQDAPLADAYIPDAGACTATGKSCVGGEVLRDCVEAGREPVDEQCNWGCLEADGAHCGKLHPMLTAILVEDLVAAGNPMLGDASIVAVDGITYLNTDDGSITGVREAGAGVSGGIEFVVRGDVGVFKFKNLQIQGSLRARGANALALVALGDVTITGRLDLRGDCGGTDPGPGGFRGANREQTAAGSGGGERGQVDRGGPGPDRSSGGAGGGYGSEGGDGGNPLGMNAPSGGNPWGEPITALIGGGGGGGGGDAGGGVGGGGGGAVQIAANGRVKVEAGVIPPYGINAGGCGGKLGSDAGGGGGAGGTIIVESKFLDIGAVAALAVNGGGGGAASSAGNGTAGQLSTDQANGGGNQQTNGRGGRGGAAGNLDGDSGGDSTKSGGGGGAVGRIVIHTWRAQGITLSGQVSPRFTDNNTTSTRGSADVR